MVSFCLFLRMRNVYLIYVTEMSSKIYRAPCVRGSVFILLISTCPCKKLQLTFHCKDNDNTEILSTWFGNSICYRGKFPK